MYTRYDALAGVTRGIMYPPPPNSVRCEANLGTQDGRKP
jgi:hypothetical protein